MVRPAGLTECAKQRLLTRGAPQGECRGTRKEPLRQPGDEIRCVVIAKVDEEGQGYCFSSARSTFSRRVMT